MVSLSLLVVVVSLLPFLCNAAIARKEESQKFTRELIRLPSSYPCTFWHEGQQFVARCGNRGLREVPSYLPPDITILDLTLNKFEILLNESFVDVPAVKKLQLSRNQLRHIMKETFYPLRCLEQLILGYNHLINLDADMFSMNQKLFFLDFGHNDFTAIPLTALNQLIPSVKKLVLSRNNISRLDFHLSENLQNLNLLNLSSNQMIAIPKIFFRIRSLVTLDISRNRIFSLTSGPLSFLSNLTYLTTVCSPQSISQFVGKSIFDFNPDTVCGPNLTIYISVSVLTFSCIIGSVLAWRNRWWLNYKCFHFRLLIIGYYELQDARERQDYRYDLNIIFPIEDEGWVLEKFMIALQVHLPDFQRNRIVCGDDDLPLGGMRFDTIDRIIENSFKNLVVVSNDSVNDANYLMMLQMAVAHMNDVQLENVVMVFREDIPDNQLPYLVRLFLSKNKPYFQWSEERYQQMLFWEGLTKTLTRNKKMNGVLPL
ncbi:uncharacterized protein [Diadema setosum]|uniref:uncharacterized protein n=1 Tax=Diadema setosum TaxID=31175 RepID=UPI003B3B4660